MKKRVFRFSYTMPQKENRPVRPHQLRDGDAFVELLPSLLNHGYEYGGLILNYQKSEDDTDKSKEAQRLLTPSDLIVLTTRPPLDDKSARDKKVVGHSRTWLEKQVFAALRRHCTFCSRGEVHLTRETSAALEDGYKNRSDLQFRINSSSAYKDVYAYRNQQEHRPWNRCATAAYLVHTRSISIEDGPHGGKGPELLAVFGMEGAVTLVWAYLLRTKFSDLLEGPRFAMAEIVMENQDLLSRPITLSFADSWEAKIIANRPL